jgi:hypothetical protein
VTIDGVWIGELDLLTHLYTPLGSTSNYGATGNLHTLQITAAPAMHFPAFQSLRVVTWQRIHIILTVARAHMMSPLHSLISLQSSSTAISRDSFNSDSAESESESYVTTDGQPASQSGNLSTLWGLRTDRYYCLTVAGLLMWDALSDERTGLSFTIAAGPRQRSHLQVRVP